MRSKQVGAIEELQASLARIPPEEAGPRVWQAQELCAFDRLARLAQDRSSETFDAALRIWDDVMGLSWPKGSRFPGRAHRASGRHDRSRPGPPPGALAGATAEDGRTARGATRAISSCRGDRRPSGRALRRSGRGGRTNV